MDSETRTARAGEKKQLILQTIAEMLEQPQSIKITTALLAHKLDVSEAALYRHFASKAQMYEGLIEFVEQGMFSVIARIEADQHDGIAQAEAITASLLRFAQRNRGLTRVLVGEALVHENPRLQARINQLLDRLEAQIRQALKIAIAQGRLAGSHDVAAHANALMSVVTGHWQRFVKTGFKADPLAHWPAQRVLLGLAARE